MKIRFFKRIEYWAAFALFVFFFLPWASLRGNAPLNGYQIATTMHQSSSLASAFGSPPPSFGAYATKTVDPPDTSLMAFTAILIYFIPIGAVFSILVDPITHNSRPGIIYFFLAIIPFIVLAIMLTKLGPDLFHSMSIGAYLTLAAAALCFIGVVRSPVAPRVPHNPNTL